MKLDISYDSNDANWLDEILEGENPPNFVNGLIPCRFERYVKIFFPVGLLEANDNRVQKFYKELAVLAKIEYRKSFSFTDLVEKLQGLPSNFIVLKEKDELIIDALTDILGENADCVFHGFGDDIVPEAFEQSWTISGKLRILKEIFTELNLDNYHDFNHFPNYIFSNDKNWCIGTTIFQSGIIIIGCTKATADLILRNETIESIALEYNDEYFSFLKPR